MARNKVQFQKGLSEVQFASLYGTEDQCREAVMRWRWPSGFVCPVCGGKHHSVVKTRALYRQEVTVAEDVKRQVAVAIVIAVEETALLVSMQRVVGGIDIEDDLPRRTRVGLDKHFDQ